MASISKQPSSRVTDGVLCQTCGKSFSSTRSVKQHEKIVHKKDGPFTCCDINFRSASHLTRHMCSRHGAEKKFKCNQCQKTFAINADLQRHIRRERNQLRYTCQCGNKFETQKELTDHRQTHEEQASKNVNICRICNKSFSFKTNMYRHMKVHK